MWQWLVWILGIKLLNIWACLIPNRLTRTQKLHPLLPNRQNKRWEMETRLKTKEKEKTHIGINIVVLSLPWKNCFGKKFLVINTSTPWKMKNYSILTEHNKCIFSIFTWTIGHTINFISGIHHSCEKKKYWIITSEKLFYFL